MKTVKSVILLCCAALIAACSNSKNPALSGVYVNQSQSQYSVAWDTLIIDAVSLADKTYQVESRTTFQKIRNGQKLPSQFKKESWQAVWNSEQQVLSENEFGRQIRVSPDTPGVLIKTTLYRKIR
jgi:hypothetical protein